MKKLIPFIIFLSPSSAFAEITAKYVTAASFSIDSPYVITNAAPSSYSISGNNITTSTGTGDSVVTNAIGGLNLGSLSSGVPALIQTNKVVSNSGSAFSLSESYQAGDSTQSAITPSSGIATLPVLGGQTTVISGGTLGSGSISSVSSGIHTCSGAFGSGTSCTASTTVSIEID